MGKEGEWLTRRAFLRDVGVTAAGGSVVAVPTAGDLGNAHRIFDAFVAPDAFSSQRPETDSPYPFDVIVIPGAGMQRKQSSGGSRIHAEPSRYGKMRLIAAAVALR